MSKEPYIGSVRFFRHVFLGIFAFCLIAPSAIAIRFWMQARQSELVAAQMQVQMVEYQKTMAEQKNSMTPLSGDGSAEMDTVMPDPIAKPEPAPEPEPEPEPLTLDYQKDYPDMYVTREKTVPVEEKTLYPTFDDGPSNVTDSVLDTLADKNVHGTFFVVGTGLDDPANQERLLRIVEEGHTLGLHTYSHVYRQVYASVEAYLDDFYMLWDKVYEITGVKCTAFRFPGGSVNGYNGAIYQEIIAEMTRRGFTYHDWNASSEDAVSSSGSSVDRILQSACAGAKYNQVNLLMHDSSSKSTTAAALPQIIDFYQTNGYAVSAITPTVPAVKFGYLS